MTDAGEYLAMLATLMRGADTWNPYANNVTITDQGIKITTGKYKSVSQIKAECRKERRREPVFILSKSKIWRKRAARIIYGKEDEDYFL